MPPGRPPTTQPVYESEFPSITYWHCDDCQQSGQVAHDQHADVWAVYTRLMDNHRKVSPTCDGGRWQIRVSLKPVEDWSNP